MCYAMDVIHAGLMILCKIFWLDVDILVIVLAEYTTNWRLQSCYISVIYMQQTDVFIVTRWVIYRRAW